MHMPYPFRRQLPHLTTIGDHAENFMLQASWADCVPEIYFGMPNLGYPQDVGKPVARAFAPGRTQCSISRIEPTDRYSMKILLFAALIALTSSSALADTQCRKNAEGEVTCQNVSGESAKDSETTDQPVTQAQPTEDGEQQASEEPQGGEVGDKTSQSRDPGITY